MLRDELSLIVAVLNGYPASMARDDALRAVLRVTALAGAQAEPVAWLPIAAAPRDGTNILLRFGSDGVSQGKYVPGTPHPWKFIETNDGITWLVNHSVDGPGGPSHYMPMPDAKPKEKQT